MAVTAAELTKLVEAVLAAAKRAEGGDAAEQGRAVDGLKALKRQRVSTKLLSETQAGKRVKALAKHPKPDIAAAAGEAVAAWKDAVVKEAAAGAAAAKEGSSAGAAAAAAAAEGEPSSQQTAAPAAAQPAAAAAPPLDLGSLPRSGDPLRDKCRQNLAQAFHLAVGEGVEGDAAVCGVAVENEIFRQAGGAVTQAYKAKFRNLHFNLKDDKNPDLRRKVLGGEIAPDELVQLPPEELASDAKRGENQKIREKKLFDSAPAAPQATTNQFQCGKCKQRKCTYYQMQTRSADEPMTNFVSCVACGHRWKFC